MGRRRGSRLVGVRYRKGWGKGRKNWGRLELGLDVKYRLRFLTGIRVGNFAVF